MQELWNAARSHVGQSLKHCTVDKLLLWRYDDHIGITVAKRFSGFAPTGWKVAAVDGSAPDVADSAWNAIDGNPDTLWQMGSASAPHSLTVDMGSDRRIGGLSYLPRQDKSREGVIETYHFETSVDGKSWVAAITDGRFDNIRNNPVLQEVVFAPVTARFFRFTALKDVEGGTAVSVATISVLPVTMHW
ncbi:MAG: discoidin domain-containing protein [Fibrella sp.]|nr:discoidin domain-containing protein [Armatimonadota bacterium]